jgi:hypothetical protein
MPEAVKGRHPNAYQPWGFGVRSVSVWDAAMLFLPQALHQQTNKQTNKGTNNQQPSTTHCHTLP